MPVWQPKARHQCPDCECWEGERHREGCTCELCPAPACLTTWVECRTEDHESYQREPFML